MAIEHEALVHDTKPVTAFEFIEFNRVRWMRDKEAAKIYVLEGGVGQGYLWMSVDDLRANIRDFGPSDALDNALNAYGEKP